MTIRPSTDRTDSPSQKPKMFTVEQLAACLCVLNGISITDEIDGSPNWWMFSDTAEKMLSAVSEIGAQPNAAAQVPLPERMRKAGEGEVSLGETARLGEPLSPSTPVANPASAAPSDDKSQTPITDRLRLAYNISHGAPSILVEAAERIEQLERELNAARSATRASDDAMQMLKAVADHIEALHDPARILSNIRAFIRATDSSSYKSESEKQ